MNKIDYIGLVSHEIKTPIASITGYADIIRNGMVDEDTVKCTFHEDVRAITPGQSVVFYQNDYVFGGGIII